MNRANLIRESVERNQSPLSATHHTKFVMIPGHDWEWKKWQRGGGTPIGAHTRPNSNLIRLRTNRQLVATEVQG
jgi:hypothetical protein